MKEDYLWNKTGADADIARLEDLLSELRYVPAAAPVIKRSRPRWIWSLIPVGAAAAVTVAAVVWMNGVRAPEMAAVEMPVIVPVVEHMPIVVPKEQPAPVEPLRAERPQVTNAVYRPRAASTLRAKKRSSRPFTETLTAEEKQAYRQVLLALYITGSQLKSVNDTIDGIEATKPIGNDK